MGERVFVVEKEKLKTIDFNVYSTFYFNKIKFNDILEIINNANPQFIDREIAEKDDTFLQIIPYVLIFNNAHEIFTYTRNGTEVRLKGLRSAGIGGHINDTQIMWDLKKGNRIREEKNIKEKNIKYEDTKEEDTNEKYIKEKYIKIKEKDINEKYIKKASINEIKNIIYDNLKREIKEEVGIEIKDYSKIKFLGIIGENKTEVGKVHIGLVFKYTLSEYGNNLLKVDKNEIHNFKWVSKKEYEKEKNRYEYWSRLALNLTRKSYNMYCLFSHKMIDKQIEDAVLNLCVENIFYLPENLQKKWSQVDPYVESINKVSGYFKKYLLKFASKKDYILIQGDFGLTYQMVNFAFKSRFVPVYATTKRVSIEKKNEKNKVEKTLVFEHVRFRKYRK